VWVLALMSLLWLTATAVSLIGEAAVARHRVESAADLAALAVVQRSPYGVVAACATAAQVAQDSGASLVSCSLAGDVAEVTAQRRLPGLLGWTGPVRFRARAGHGLMGVTARVP